jgi:hypothetical protein
VLNLKAVLLLVIIALLVVALIAAVGENGVSILSCVVHDPIQAQPVCSGCAGACGHKRRHNVAKACAAAVSARFQAKQG